MAIYTYEVDHGDDEPRVFAGMFLNRGHVVAVEFGAAISRMVEYEERENSGGHVAQRMDQLGATNATLLKELAVKDARIAELTSALEDELTAADIERHPVLNKS